MLVSYAADAPLAGVLRLYIDPACIMGMPPMSDVENDGLVEANSWQGTVQVDVPVVLGPRPIPVRLGADTVNFGGATCIVTSSIQFVPLVANLQTAGAACGPSLGGVVALPPPAGTAKPPSPCTSTTIRRRRRASPPRSRSVPPRCRPARSATRG